jgi:hypothetical protein
METLARFKPVSNTNPSGIDQPNLNPIKLNMIMSGLLKLFDNWYDFNKLTHALWWLNCLNPWLASYMDLCCWCCENFRLMLA